jgi:hypothetical protein
LRKIVDQKLTGSRLEDALRALKENFHSAIVPIFSKAIAREGRAFAKLATGILESPPLSPELAYQHVMDSGIRGIGPNWISECSMPPIPPNSLF